MFSPSLVPGSETIFIVEDNLGAKLGRIWCETNVNRADRATVLNDLYRGEYNDPLRVISINISEGGLAMSVKNLQRSYSASPILIGASCPER